MTTLFSEHCVIATFGITLSQFVIIAAATVSAVATYRQGRDNAKIADMNAQRANQEARQQLAIGKIQQMLEQRQAEMELALAGQEAAAARANASAIDNERLASEARSREEQRRQREEARKLLAEQGALYSGSGVVTSTGTPLAVMAATVQNEESRVIDQHYISNVESTKAKWEASLERARAGRVDSAGRAQYAINIEASKVRGLASQLNARNKMSQAEIDRQAGRLQRKQAMWSAVGSFAGGVASAVK